MAYFTPYIDETGFHFPTYQDIVDDMVAGAKSIFGSDIYLENDSADYQLISIFALKTQSTWIEVVEVGEVACQPL